MVYGPPMRFLVVAALFLVACESDGGKKSSSETPVEGPGKELLGINPEKWQCDLVAPPAELARIFGGEAKLLDSPFTPPRGVPDPCSYAVTTGAPDADGGAALVESWTFDIDCREDYEKRAEMLFAQYAQTSADLVAEYQKHTAGAGRPPTDDAGVPVRAPTASAEASVGRKALDHHGQGLLFVDADAPCYVRIVGPDPAKRLALAQLVEANLVEKNAPMKPHGDPVMTK